MLLLLFQGQKNQNKPLIMKAPPNTTITFLSTQNH